MQGENRYFRRSHLSEAKFRAIVRYFAHDLPASKIAELSDVSRPTINQLLRNEGSKSSMVFHDKRFIIHLKECEFRFNRREENLV